MAVGYEKINTSAARSKRRRSDDIPRSEIKVYAAGELLWDAHYGNGKTLDEFVANCDKVMCEFDSGHVVEMRGSAVKVMINERMARSG